MLNELVAKIKQDVANVEKSTEKQMLIDHFNRTLDYIKSKSNIFSGISL